MNEYIVALIYFMFSSLGVVWSFIFANKHSGSNFKTIYFWIGLALNCFLGLFHVGVGQVGYNPFIPATEKWLSGNDFVGWIALFFVIPQLLRLPNKSSPRKQGRS